MEFCANRWCYMEKNKTTVYLGGTEFKLKISESEEYIQGLAAYVNSQIASVQNQFPGLGENRGLLLSMLNMADEYFRLKEKYDALDTRISALRDMPRSSGPIAMSPSKRPFENKAPAPVGADS